jgi:hypothetical protein
MPDSIEKLTRVWSQRREREVAVRIEYRVEEGTCPVIHLERVEMLE